MQQTNLFQHLKSPLLLQIEEGKKLRDEGIQVAIEHADTVTPNWQNPWSEKAFNFLKRYIKRNKRFMVEEVREASKHFIPEPPSARAWGAVIKQAKKVGLVTPDGYAAVKNKKAHRTPATVWKVITN